MGAHKKFLIITNIENDCAEKPQRLFKIEFAAKIFIVMTNLMCTWWVKVLISLKNLFLFLFWNTLFFSLQEQTQTNNLHPPPQKDAPSF